MPTATAVEVRQITVTGARTCFTEEITENGDVEKLLKFLVTEIMCHNPVVLVICVGNEQRPQVAILDN